ACRVYGAGKAGRYWHPGGCFNFAAGHRIFKGNGYAGGCFIKNMRDSRRFFFIPYGFMFRTIRTQKEIQTCIIN
ncbi:MAG: hypothetical protein K2O15_09865, partial [Lachnospiraceae bacterium]|nr:hypothetical protein [Lachnospiraceae bacterium]